MPEHRLCTQQLHLVHKIQVSSHSYVLAWKLGSFHCYSSPASTKSLSLFYFYFQHSYCHSFVPSCVSHFQSSQLSMCSTKSSAQKSFFITSSLASFVIFFITVVNTMGLSIEPWWAPTFTSNSSDLSPLICTVFVIFLYISVMTDSSLTITPSFLSAYQITSLGT